MPATIPVEAVQGILNVPALVHCKLPFANGDLDNLSVKDLKLIYSTLRRNFKFFGARQALKRFQKKDLIQEIRQSFYMDPECTLVNTAAVEALTVKKKSKSALAQTKKSPVVASASTSSASCLRALSPDASRAMQDQPIPRHRPQPLLPGPFSSSGFPTSTDRSHAAATAGYGAEKLFASSASPSGGKRGRCSPDSSSSDSETSSSSETSSPSMKKTCTRPSLNPWSVSQNASATTTTTNNNNNTSTVPKTNAPMPVVFPPYLSMQTYQQVSSLSQASSAKRDSNPEDKDNTPQGVMETKLMAEMLGMGFTNRAEILGSIRKLLEKTQQQEEGSAPVLTSDEVMCDIVAMRELAEDSRAMDMARLASEQDRWKNAEERRKLAAQQKEQELQNATVSQWIENKDMFKGSWLLKSDLRAVICLHVTEAVSSLKKKLIELLKLEKRCRGWYSQLPRSYFEELAAKLCKLEQYDLLESKIESETALLIEGVALLSEQQGMVPRMFVQAHDAVQRRLGGVDVLGDNDVVFLEARMSSQREKPHALDQEEAIEIS